VVERSAPPFTPAEYARARALVDVAAEVRRTSGIRYLVALPGGDEIEIRPATVADCAAVEAMHGRCSAASLHARFFDGRPAVRLGGSPAVTYVAVGGPGLVVAAGTVAFDGPDAEVALLVEDAAQRRGVGSTLLRRLVGVAEQEGAVVVHAHARRDNAAMAATVARLGRPVSREADGPVETISIDVRVATDALP
jgi:GNAT superfamily N-acetyltransferase